ncbi:deoxyribonuclease V [Hamadaea flava]|uniref:Endonuclease V n=1 Tax=Hamadaea flava TaxID=1742688 RepID=A0ABV8LM04_9ACTN|nr:endonuclease V [Hamadaea flava]MCP2323814.1 deoxyribonuclease V [Hamadaea flava]
MTFPATPEEAIALQERLRDRVRVDVPLPGNPALVAGVDVAYADSEDTEGLVAGAIVILDAATLDVVESASLVGRAEFPYVPGLLAFRELPTLLSIWEGLRHRPDVVVCDGYGVAHPRRFGLACHFGLLTGVPTFGVGKTAFVGSHAPVGDARGASADLMFEGDVVGRALRTRTGVKPVFVSAGHLIDLDGACSVTLSLTSGYRLPETTRQADRLSRDALRTAMS